MSFVQFFGSDPVNQCPPDKVKKIYLHTRKSYNENRKMLNQLVQINSRTIQQMPQLPLEGSIKRYLTSEKTEFSSLRKFSDNRSKQFNIWEKRKELKTTIVSDIYSDTINSNSPQKPKLQHSLRIHFASPQHQRDIQLIKIQQSCGSLPSLTQKQKGILIMPNKKNSCPHQKKRHSISFADESNQNPNQYRHRKNLLSQQIPPKQWDSIRFIKDCKVSGHKIYNLTKNEEDKNEQILRSYGNQTDLNDKNRTNEANHIIEKYYSLIKNTDYGRLTNHSGKKVIKNHFDKLQTKRNNQEKKPSRIGHVHTETFMKVQAMFTCKNKTQVNE